MSTGKARQVAGTEPEAALGSGADPEARPGSEAASAREAQAGSSASDLRQAFDAALPIMLGYIAIGIPCGILCNSIGMGPLHVFLLSALFYSGAGQFMIPNMFLAGNPLVAIIASVSLVNTRQMLYSASLSQYCQTVRKRLAFVFAATVTDESFGVNTAKFEAGDWTVRRALLVNLCSQASWTVSNVVGALIGSAVSIPLAIASFAMTSIFICLASTQKDSLENWVAIIAAMVGVYLAKLVGLSGAAILLGAVFGVVCAIVCFKLHRRGVSDDVEWELAEKGAVSDHAVFSAKDRPWEDGTAEGEDDMPAAGGKAASSADAADGEVAAEGCGEAASAAGGEEAKR